MKIGVIGLGYWGPNLVRNFLAHKEVTKVVACDLRQERRSFIQDKFPSAVLESDCTKVIEGDCDIVVIATPVDTHYTIGMRALEAGKHIWVEKPFTSTSAEAEALIELAEKKNLKIFVDHTFIYNGAVRKIKELVDRGELGNVIYFDSERINLGLFGRIPVISVFFSPMITTPSFGHSLKPTSRGSLSGTVLSDQVNLTGTLSPLAPN